MVLGSTSDINFGIPWSTFRWKELCYRCPEELKELLSFCYENMSKDSNVPGLLSLSNNHFLLIICCYRSQGFLEDKYDFILQICNFQEPIFKGLSKDFHFSSNNFQTSMEFSLLIFFNRFLFLFLLCFFFDLFLFFFIIFVFTSANPGLLSLSNSRFQTY